MAGDIPLRERLVLVPPTTGTVESFGVPSGEPAAAGFIEGERVFHVYGNRVRIVEGEQGMPEAPAESFSVGAGADYLTEVEKLGIEAYKMRISSEYATAKANRPRQGETWNLPEGGCAGAVPSTALEFGVEAAAPPTSAYLEGNVAVGIIIVDGPTAALKFTAAERTKVVAEVQNGLSFYAAAYPAAGLTFVYDIRTPTISAPANPAATDLEAVFRDPAMAAMGFPGNWSGVGQYIESLRTNLKTRWTYCVFFTKYPVGWFAYASIGGPRIVMQYSNDGWGPDNIDRVFAHESGHIFGCPDEYAGANCDCGGTWGRWGKPNLNCEKCAPGGGIKCLMKGNDFTFCTSTPAHLGWVAARLFAKHSGRSLDVTGASTASGAQVIQWDYHGGENQLFRPDPVGGGYFRFVCQQTGKVLDVSGASTANGAKIIVWDWHGGDNQLFKLELQPDGYLRVVAKHSGKVFDITGISTVNGAQLQQWDWWGGDNQRFLATAPIVAKHSGRVLDITAGSTANGAQLQQWDYNGLGNQIFKAEPVGGGYVRFVVQKSGKVLDVSGASTANGAKIVQWDWWGGDNQKFRIEPVGDGHNRIVAKHSGKVFDVSGISTAAGAQLVQWDWWGGPNQRFLIPQWSS